TFPTTLFVRADGTIVEQVAGEISVDDLTRALSELMGA
ncbi:MAG: TlpA family protein disulfide reductase, partial [Actinobacteria bacterium]|nr:TlpA family protein disulfide reductase [Actinomycetota bacterium]